MFLLIQVPKAKVVNPDPDPKQWFCLYPTFYVLTAVVFITNKFKKKGILRQIFDFSKTKTSITNLK